MKLLDKIYDEFESRDWEGKILATRWKASI